MANRAKSIRNLFIKGSTYVVQTTCSSTHIGLRYGLDIVEGLESKFMRRAHGQLKEATIKDRRNHTNHVRLNNERLYIESRDSIRKILADKFGSKEDVIIEGSLHGNA